MSAQQEAAAEAGKFVDKLNEVILFPTIALLTAVAFLVFLWGCFEYFINSNNEQARQQGVKHITFGIIGLVVMVSAFAILRLVLVGFALDDDLDCANDPSGRGCEKAFVIPDGGNTAPGTGEGGGNTAPGG
jgi:hypothetical protein